MPGLLLGTLGAVGLIYCNSKKARNTLVSTYNWKIFNDLDCNDKDSFITLWDTTRGGSSNFNQISIPTQGTGYNYTVNWGDGTTDTEVKGNITHTYITPGKYFVSISKEFPSIYFFRIDNTIITKDNFKILEIKQWGTIKWRALNFAFHSCSVLNVTATDVPDLSMVTDISNMFRESDLSIATNLSKWDVSTITNMSGLFGASNFNEDISDWDVSRVTNMSSMFIGTPFNQNIGNWNVSQVTDLSNIFPLTPFNQNIGNWDVSNVTDMTDMFRETPFNQDINKWNVSQVTNMSGMFASATSFNQDISKWEVNNVTVMNGIFASAKSFNQNLGNWDIRNVGKAIPSLISSGLSTDNYDKTLIGWAALIPKGLAKVPGTFLRAGNLTYCNGKEARNALIAHGWGIEGDREDCTTLDATEFDIIPEISIYPNPATELLNVNLEIVSKADNYQVFDLSGRKILSGSLLKDKNSISVATLPKGVYLIRIIEANNIYTTKFIKS